MKNELISIIIPVYNEGEIIEKTISGLKKFTECEIIFVDCGSADDTVGIIKTHFPVFSSAKKGRASQMNYGALASKGEILLFLHADSILADCALEKIHETIGSGYKVGCFKIKFDSKSPLMKACAFFSSSRVKWRNIAFGDQGIFISRDYFDYLGGFKEIPLMEDYQLSMDIKKDGEKINLCNCRILTSERRFLKKGRLKTMWLMQKLQLMYRKGACVEEIARLYK